MKTTTQLKRERYESLDAATKEQLWKDPDWQCPNCRFTNLAVRTFCRNCGYDSDAGEFPYYNPLPPYEGIEHGS